MNFRRRALTYTVCAVVLAATTGGANATCNWGGAASNKWYFYSLQANTPAIKATTVTVKNASNVNQQIKVFQNIAAPFQNGTAVAIKCLLTISNTGAIASSPCTSWPVNNNGVSANATVTGQLNSTGAATASATACDFTGTLNVSADPTPVAIRAGHVIGTNGAGLATQGPSRDYHFSLVKF